MSTVSWFDRRGVQPPFGLAACFTPTTDPVVMTYTVLRKFILLTVLPSNGIYSKVGLF